MRIIKFRTLNSHALPKHCTTDSVEYGLTDIQEYYANTGALKKAAENRKKADESGQKKKVALSVIEAFGGGGATGGGADVQVKDVEDGKNHSVLVLSLCYTD